MTDNSDIRPEDQNPATPASEPVSSSQPQPAYGESAPAPAAPEAEPVASPRPQPQYGEYAPAATVANPASPSSHGAPAAYGTSYGAPSAYGTWPSSSHQDADASAFGSPAATSSTPDHRPRTSAVRITGLLVAAAIVGGAAGLGGSAAGLTLWSPKGSVSAASGPQSVTVNDPSSVNQTTAVASKVLPSVVTINASSGNEGGTGSGVILSADGYVVTNTHVVTLDGQSGDATLQATTSDGRIYSAKVVGTDPIYDLAVIKLVGASNLTPITFGDSSKLNVGDQTIAVGAPLGLSNTVTSGIVSALNRSISIASSAAPKSDSSDDNGQQNGGLPFQFDFGQGQQNPQQQSESTIKIAVIQTDAPINPGNSGGALVDSSGKLIGINVAIASTGSSSSSGGQTGNIGVGFSIPSNIVKREVDEIIKTGSATHGLLGASVQDAADVQGATIAGAYIANVTSGGGAAAAGLQKGDVVTLFNGVPITNAIDLTAQVRALPAGAKTSLTYVRGGNSYTVDVTLGTLPAS